MERKERLFKRTPATETWEKVCDGTANAELLASSCGLLNSKSLQTVIAEDKDFLNKIFKKEQKMDDRTADEWNNHSELLKEFVSSFKKSNNIEVVHSNSYRKSQYIDSKQEIEVIQEVKNLITEKNLVWSSTTYTNKKSYKRANIGHIVFLFATVVNDVVYYTKINYNSTPDPKVLSKKENRGGCWQILSHKPQIVNVPLTTIKGKVMINKENE